jgi:uncharacterized protein YbjQ (UPF0145 family)
MFDLIVVIVLLTLGFFIGNYREQKHFDEIRKREAHLKDLPIRSEAASYSTGEVRMVCGSVVVASDYFKSFVANIKNFFGGRLSTFESLLDRARREAILRMKEEAQAWGATEVLDVRLNTSFVDQLGIEVSAVGTAYKK